MHIVCVQSVYWSDVKKRTVFSSHLTGTGNSVFIDSSDGLGFVEGIDILYVAI